MQNTIQHKFEKEIIQVQTRDELEAVYQTYFARKSGSFSKLMQGLKDLSKDERKLYGKALNDMKMKMEKAYDSKKAELNKVELSAQIAKEHIDVTQPKLPVKERGHIHPRTQVRWQLEDVMSSMGFIVEDGPELESDYYVFDTLNIPSYHPARDTQDTFYIKNHPDWTMRSHVSNMQVRLMHKYNENGTKPIRAAYPGRTFRNEATDATHEHTFYQFEALMVDRHITIANLVGVIKELLHALYKRNIEVRLRPSYFPFVEPGFELDIKYVDTNKNEKWMEMLGCGLMHPNVLKAAGYDSHKWNGLAFGMGLDRLVLLKYGIEDIRFLMSCDLRFLKQF